MEKDRLRKLYLEKRKNLSLKAADLLTRGILRQFASLDFSQVRYFHLFYPIPGKHEFNSLVLADWLRLNHPEIKLVLSRSDLKNHTLTHIIWNPDTPLAMNSWGITEPVSGAEIAPGELDFVLVPLLIFDTRGNRVGYGKGFYDRFLTQCRPDVIKAGVSFFEPEINPIPVNEHDIPLNLCLTPQQVWRF
ncbi:5-formyltetrahydrofolate cyclo-ligase (plasmid) [Pedobacter sp. BS3]|uniref:5-formyltetrahydrofolate cyclo-ligase n=1 Tax=Pedobacter sp. BS3 TaxID=2567937 RepID=UPI0011ED9086|nr:5-formyltetrahydrofolate cyclo-ligase [Pedobacter sp. BS3]TZF86125.1 5-formyltetrahydrofolate cyclo-ligase [Pedobacter sp. BS3]